MPDLSIIEFAVYGFFAYSAMLVLMVSVLINPAATKVGSITRSIYLIPGIFCAGILSATGQKIFMPTTITNSTSFTINGTTGSLLTNSTTVITEQTHNLLLNPAWIYVHLAFSLILTFYIIYQMLLLLGVGVDKNTRPS